MPLTADQRRRYIANWDKLSEPNKAWVLEQDPSVRQAVAPGGQAPPIATLEPRGAQAVMGRTVGLGGEALPISASEAPTIPADPLGQHEAEHQKSWFEDPLQFIDPTWRRTILELGVPLATLLLTRRLGPSGGLMGPLTTAAKTAIGTGAGSLLAEKVDPSQHPVQEAGRKSLEAGGAALGGTLIPYPGVEAGLTRRAVTGLERLGTTGLGAATGSIAAETFDPSADPQARAAAAGTGAATGQALMSPVQYGVGRFVGPGRNLSPLGREVAETMAEQKVAIPAEVSESRPLRLLGKAGEYSMLGGKQLAQATREGMERLTTSVGNVLTQMRGGRTAAEVQPFVNQMYADVRRVVQSQLTAPNRPVYTSPELTQAATELQGLIPAGATSPVYQWLRGLARQAQAPQWFYAQASSLGRDLQRAEALGTAQGLPPPIQQALTRLSGAFQPALASDRVVDARQVVPALQRYAALLETYMPENPPKALLERLGALQGQQFISFDEAMALRGELGALARRVRGGGASAVPTATGGHATPGMGGTSANTLGSMARQANQSLDTAMEDIATRLGFAGAWRGANQARRMQAQSEWVGDLVQRATDPMTRMVRGERLLSQLQQARYAQDLYGTDFDPAAIANLERFARALGVYQHGRGALGAYLGRGTGEGRREAFHLTPGSLVMRVISEIPGEPMGAALASPFWSRLLTLGLQVPEGSREAAAITAQLLGLLGSRSSDTPAPEMGGQPLALSEADRARLRVQGAGNAP